MGVTNIRGAQIKDEDITSDDIGDAAVRGATDNGGSQREIALGTISDIDLRDNAVTAAKLDDTGSFTMAELLAATGSAADPSITFSGDPDVGLYSGGTNILGIATAGTAAITIDANQDVDFLQHEAQQLVVHVLSSDPVSPVEGQVWYNSTTEQWKGRNSSTTVILG